MTDNTNLQSALRKVKRFSARSGQWSGYLTPSEILALVEGGATGWAEWTVTWAKEKIAKGESNPIWFYFVPSKQQQKQLPPTRVKRHGRT